MNYADLDRKTMKHCGRDEKYTRLGFRNKEHFVKSYLTLYSNPVYQKITGGKVISNESMDSAAKRFLKQKDELMRTSTRVPHTFEGGDKGIDVLPASKKDSVAVQVRVADPETMSSISTTDSVQIERMMRELEDIQVMYNRTNDPEQVRTGIDMYNRAPSVVSSEYISSTDESYMPYLFSGSEYSDISAPISAVMEGRFIGDRLTMQVDQIGNRLTEEQAIQNVRSMRDDFTDRWVAGTIQEDIREREGMARPVESQRTIQTLEGLQANREPMTQEQFDEVEEAGEILEAAAGGSTEYTPRPRRMGVREV